MHPGTPWWRCAAALDMEPDKVRELLQLSQEPISLETPVGEEEDAHLEDFIQDEEAGVPVDEAGRQLLRRELHINQKGCISEDRSLFFIVFTYLSPVL